MDGPYGSQKKLERGAIMARELKKSRDQASEAPRSNDEMSLADAKAWRASLYRPAANKALSEKEKREAFRLFWAQEKYKYGKSKDLEGILWLHLKASKLDEPAKFSEGLQHFGLKKILG